MEECSLPKPRVLLVSDSLEAAESGRAAATPKSAAPKSDHVGAPHPSSTDCAHWPILDNLARAEKGAVEVAGAAWIPVEWPITAIADRGRPPASMAWPAVGSAEYPAADRSV
jgi:hypothetical protein